MPAIDRHKPLKRLKRGVQISSYRLSVSFFFVGIVLRAYHAQPVLRKEIGKWNMVGWRRLAGGKTGICYLSISSRTMVGN